MKKTHLTVGHRPKSGARGVVDEYEESLRITKKVFDILKTEYKSSVTWFTDKSNNSQSKNLSTLLDSHRRKKADLNILFHLNAFTPNATGTEVLYNDPSMKKISSDMSKVIAGSLKIRDRGAKVRQDLYLLNNLKGDILLECFFITNDNDVTSYKKNFNSMCYAIAKVIADYCGYKAIEKSSYSVKSGDTLWSISVKHGTTVENIRKLNKGKKLDPLKIGLKLKVK